MSRYISTHSIEYKHALIIGASSGIGEAVAFMLAEQGCHLTLLARRTEKVFEVKNRILEHQPNTEIATETFDVCKVNEIERFCASLKDVDILVHCAGLAFGTPAADTFDVQQMNIMFETNVISAMAFFRALVPQMRARNDGHVVFVGSVAGFECYEGGSVYNATKHALTGFANASRMDLANSDVRVTLVNPGIVKSDFWLVRFDGDEEKAKNALKGIEPLTVWDVADQIVYALTRPMNTQVSEIRSYANHQAHAKYVIHRQ